METLCSYYKTQAERNVLQCRYDLLEERVEYLQQKYLGVHAIRYDKMASTPGTPPDKVLLYLDAVEKKNEDGLSITEEMQELKDHLCVYNKVLSEMERQIKQINGVSEKLYVKIVFEQVKPTEAVSEIANSEFINERQVWRYYSEIKPFIPKKQKKR